MLGKDIKINDYPNDVFKAVGKIIMYSQEWEQEYKKLATILQIPIKKIDVASLNTLNNALKKENHLNEKQYRDLEGVINKRNYINHEFFLKDFHKDFKEIENILNDIQFLIFEATDVIDNLIDKLQGNCYFRRPTIFDDTKAE
ncbi:MAG: hypothetical protein K2K48_05730 [Anaeroplasmataceae bacterium]|nr:hypothetical protein [Anaeroplasmataceae bacterium]